MQLPQDLALLPTMPYDERPSSMPLDIEECRTAIWVAKGNITKAAQLLKTTSLRLRNFIRNSPRLTEELREAKEQILDIAEEVLVEALTDEEDKSRRDQMARFALTNLGNERGYGNGKGGVSINMPKGGKFEISWQDGSKITGGDDDDVIEGEVIRE